MRIRELRDVYLGQDIYIIGTGPTTNIFPLDSLRDKICISLNDAYKISPFIGPIALMHHEFYSRNGKEASSEYHENFTNIKYPVVKGRGRKQADIDWDHSYYYFYDWSHDIDQIDEMFKSSDYLYYTPEGCSLHAALQLAWIMGAKNIFTIGCDSRVFSGKHYAKYDKNGFRDNEVLERGEKRNYDSYVYGTLLIRNFLKRKGVNIFNLSPIVGYHLVDLQYSILNGDASVEDISSVGNKE